MDAGSNPANSILFLLKSKKIKTLYILYSIITGLLLSLGWPTNGNPLYLFISFVPLLYIEEKYIEEKKYKRNSYYYIFLYSFISFIIWNLISTYWLFFSKKPNGEYAFLEAYFIPSFLNSILMSFIFSFYFFIKKNIGNNRKIAYLFLISLWILFEKIHLEWEFSWPWLNLGNGFSNKIRWIQWYEYTGTLGGSLWIWIVNIGIADSIIKYEKDKNTFFLYKRTIFNIGKILLVILISNIIYIKIPKSENRYINTIILQPNIDPYNQKYSLSVHNLIHKFINLIEKKINRNPAIILGPETSFPGIKDKISIENINNHKIIHIFKNYLASRSKNSVFITGAELYSYKKKYIYNFYSKKKKIFKKLKFFNSMIKINSNNSIVSFHHKSKLVPAVESFPYKKILYPILGNIILNFGGNVVTLEKELNPTIFFYMNFGIVPIICYESIFGEYVTSFFKKKNSQIIAIITNDGWWGDSQGYKQHLSYASIRAIENRKYIIRSANTGMSCIINEKGEIVSSIPYGKEDVLYKKVFLNSKKTYYMKHGDFLSRISCVLIIIIILYTFFYKKYFI